MANESKKTAVIVNPRSGGGKAARDWPHIRQALEHRLGRFVTRFTERPGHGIALARELLEEGFERIIAAGGDGTLNEIANGFLTGDQPVRPEACLGVLNLGTGGDFRRTLGMSSNIEEMIEVLQTGVPLSIDLGKVAYTDPRGARQSRIFINLVSFGMGGAVAAASKNFLSRFSGNLAFKWATFRVFLGYRGRSVRLRLDGASEPSPFFITNVAVGNGRFHGGGMHPCPTALLDDGMLEVTVIDFLGMVQLLRDLSVLYSDDVYRHPKVHHLRGQKIIAEADEPTQIEVDGEPLGMLPLEITLLPRRLSVLVPRGSELLVS